MRGKGLGENGMNRACEMEMSIFRSRSVLRCMLVMKAEWSVGTVEVRNRPERNGAEMERIYRKHMYNQPDIFYFLHN